MADEQRRALALCGVDQPLRARNVVGERLLLNERRHAGFDALEAVGDMHLVGVETITPSGRSAAGTS